MTTDFLFLILGVPLLLFFFGTFCGYYPTRLGFVRVTGVIAVGLTIAAIFLYRSYLYYGVFQSLPWVALAALSIAVFCFAIGMVVGIFADRLGNWFETKR